MKVAIGFDLGPRQDWERAASFVQEAEKLGVDFCWTGVDGRAGATFDMMALLR